MMYPRTFQFWSRFYNKSYESIKSPMYRQSKMTPRAPFLARSTRHSLDQPVCPGVVARLKLSFTREGSKAARERSNR